MKTIFTATILGLFSFSTYADTQQTHHTDSATGAKTWETHVDGVHFSLTQILPDQAKAFYVNRGFSLEQIEPYTSSCVYMTVLRNDNAPGDIHFVSNNWSILVNNKPHKLVPVSQWVKRLSDAGVKKSAVIAFRWAQFPPEQEYKPGGDWNQGMLSIGLPADSIFNITAKWDIVGKEYEAKLEGVQCAK
ncbi:MAG: hypothetical protein OQK73_12845 [Gammaproteobacteria bacterium]|nr:hypothetical protein [Gammaproteobacteria bacterium]